MKKTILSIVLLCFLCLPMAAGIHTYADQSVLNNGNWVKIRVSESGVCRMTFDELQNAGINPNQLRVFGFGGAMLTQDFSQKRIDDLPQVPVYVGSNYVLFWVQGPIEWSYNGSRFAHTRNPYSDYGYYFLTDNVGNLLSPTQGSAVSGTPTEVTSYLNFQVHDYDSLNLIDRTGVSGGGREFYGEQFTNNQARTFRFETPNALTSGTSSAVVDIAAYSWSPTSFNISLNNGPAKNVAISAIPDNYTMACTGKTTVSNTTSSGQQQVKLTYISGNSGTYGWLNWIELTTPCALQMNGSWMRIRTDVNYQSATPVRFHLKGANSAIQIWDITDRASIRRMPTTLSGTEMQWTGSQEDGVHEYVAVQTSGDNWVRAEVVGAVANQNLHRLRNIDYVIICPEGFESVSEQLAQAHEQKQSITWAVVTDQQVYNEFSSGTPDATAYRWLMKMLYDRAGNGNAKPRWLLLMGDGTFDNRKLLVNSGANTLLTYQAQNSVYEVSAYMTDDYFGFLDDNEGVVDTQGRMDIGVGRLPVNTVEEAQEVVNKLVGYIHNERLGKWKNQLVFLADDGENGTHTETAEGSAERVRIKNPDFVVNKIYLDAYPQEVNASGESYPLAKNKLSNMLKNGVLFFDFSGHGSYNGITNEGVLSLRDIESMNNKNLAFWLFVTCKFAVCDAGKRSAAEVAVLNPKGGAVGVLSATRTVYASQNTALNRAVCDTLFGHRNVYHYDMTLGEAISIGKNRLGSDANKMSYVLLGDPAIRLNYPTDYQVETTTEVDTLHALSVQHMEGRIIDEDHQTVTDFNGEVAITVYDKMQVITTRDNDATDGNARELRYNDYPNILFSGSANVTDGTFEYTFMVPKDIRYNYGKGRIVYYAQPNEVEEAEEAVGHFEDFIIGGTGDTWYTDTVGPMMTIYLNNPAFQNGDVTYATPRFFAELYDEHGINTAGAGIGHDLMLTIDDKPDMIYSLNDYFTATNNSYQAGTVNYLMNSLTDGPHSLSFRAWDLLNNSTTQTLDFIVDSGADPSIYNVVSYPNPVSATGIMHIIVNYDQPDENITTELYIYNLNGQVLWSRTQDNPDQVQIHLSEIGLQPGVYMYNVRIKSASSKYSAASGRIIVTR